MGCELTPTNAQWSTAEIVKSHNTSLHCLHIMCHMKVIRTDVIKTMLNQSIEHTNRQVLELALKYASNEQLNPLSSIDAGM